MRFIDCLPPEAENTRFTVMAPFGGLSDVVEDYLRGRTPHMDFAIMRDFNQALIRVIPTSDGLGRQGDEVFLVAGALGIFLDEDGRETDNHVTLSGYVALKTTTRDTPAGMFTIWSQAYLGSEAS